ncbi:MAG: hypothetical protein Q8O10_05340 [candidate division Zixibacteria bacterium]|nr:hypothetical protein [candidate division Zixibacteria bacterium]
MNLKLYFLKPLKEGGDHATGDGWHPQTRLRVILECSGRPQGLVHRILVETSAFHWTLIRKMEVEDLRYKTTIASGGSRNPTYLLIDYLLSKRRCRMKKAVLIVIFLTFLGILFIVSNHADNVEKETYVSQVIIDVPWGKEPGHFGIYEPPEGGPTLGPQTLTIASNGDIYIEDGYNARIQKFSKSGEFIAMIPLLRGPDDVTVDNNGNIYMLYAGIVPNQVYKYDQKGNILKKYKLTEGTGPLFCDNYGRLFIGGPKVVYQFGTVSEEFSPEQQKATLREGFVASNNVVLNQRMIFQTRDGELHLVDDSSKSFRKFSSYRMNLGQAGFTGIDKDMNVYTCKGDLNTYSWIMRKYNPEGELLAEFTIQEDNYAHASRALVLDEYGSVYVMSTSEKGLKIIKWSPVEGGK